MTTLTAPVDAQVVALVTTAPHREATALEASLVAALAVATATTALREVSLVAEPVVAMVMIAPQEA